MKLVLGIFLFILLGHGLLHGQHRVLVIPLTPSSIVFDNSVRKVLAYNGIHQDSVKREIMAISTNRLSRHFKGFTFTNIQDMTDYAYLADSLSVLKKWNTFHANKIDSASGLEKILLLNETNPRFTYSGRVITGAHMNALQALVKQQDFDFVFVISQFETFVKRPFSGKSTFSLHFEVYDKTLTKIYGNKSATRTKIRKNMYISAFYVYVSFAIEQMYDQIRMMD